MESDRDHTTRLAEYAALRDEILGRYESRSRLIELTLLLSGAVWAASFQSTAIAPVLFVFPMLVLFLALGWTAHGIVLRQIFDYIRDEIEMHESELKWATYLSEQRRTNFGWAFYGSASSIGLFVGVQIVTICLAIYLHGVSEWEWVLLGLGVVSAIGTWMVLGNYLSVRLHTYHLKSIRRITIIGWSKRSR